MSVPENLRAMANTFEERNKLYGDNYIVVGKVMAALFPDGVKINSSDDQVRYHLFSWMVGKLTRYAANWENGHPDSIHDLAVYTAMLEEFDQRIKIKMTAGINSPEDDKLDKFRIHSKLD